MPVSKKTSSEFIPRSPAQAKAWVADLPLTDLGETTRRLYLGLVDLNQSRIAPIARIEVSETIRPVAELVLGNLKRHLISRAFPLPMKSQKIFDLTQSLLLELGGAYQLAALDMLTSANVSKKQLLKAIYRSMDYMGRVLLQSYVVYVKIRDTIWHDIHHLFLLACENGLEKVKVSRDKDSFASIQDIYKYINLLSLSCPYSLRQGEIERLERFFRVVLPKVSISPNPDSAKGEYAHVAYLNNDEPAVLVPVSDLLNSPTIRLFDLSALISLLDAYISSVEEKGEAKKYYLFSSLNRGLVKRVAFHLTQIRNRSFERYPRDEKIKLISGLANVAAMIRMNQKEAARDEPDEEDYIFSALNMSAAPRKNQAGNTETTYQHGAKPQTWQLENSSTGGFGLCWKDKVPSGARVGEILGVKTDSEDQWQVCTIRWLEFVKGKGLCMGVELLSPDIEAVDVKAVLNRRASQKMPIAGLKLPRIEGIRPDPELVFPAQMFETGDDLLLGMSTREEKVRISSQDECMGSFAICTYSTLTMNTVDEEDDEDDFSSVWGAL